MMTQRASRPFCRRLIVIGLALAGLCSCGKKAPPVVPQVLPPPAMAEVQGQLQEGRVTLTWLHGSQHQAVAGYVVFRAQSALSRPDCPQCPLIFQKVDTIRVEGKSQTVQFSQAVPGGFRYTYKVRPFQSSGAQGADSNVVVLEALP